MDEAHSTATWNHTASLMALIANLKRDPEKTPPYSPEFFHPLKHQADPVEDENFDAVDYLERIGL